MAEIITPDEIKAVGDLTHEFNRLGIVLDDVIEKGQESQSALDQTKQVKELLKVIEQLRDKEKQLVDANNKLKDSQDKATKSTHNQEEAIDALDETTGGTISRVKELGKQLWALAKNPVVLTLAAIVATLAACAAAVKIFFSSVGEGEDTLDRQTTSWNQFFNVLKKNFADLGSSIAGWFEKMGGSSGFIHGTINALKLMFPFLSDWLNKVQADFIKTEEDAQKLTKTLDELEDRMILNITKRARTNTEANKLMLASEDKINLSAKQRIDLLQRGIDLKQKQLKEDQAIAGINAKAVLLEIGHTHALTDAETLRMTQSERFAMFTAEENKRIAEAMAEVINLEGQYAQEVKKNTTKIVALKEQIRTEAVKKAQDSAEKEIQAAKNIEEKAVANIKNRAVAGAITVKEAEEQITEFRKRAAESYVNTQIEALSKVLLTEELNADERAAVEQKLFDLKNNLVDVYYENIEAKTKISLEDIVAVYEDFSSSLNDLFSSITENRLQQLDMEQKKMEEKYAREIELAGENEETKAILEKEREKREEALEKRRIQLQRRAAIFDKTVSATQAAIQTSLAIIRMLANPGGPVGVGLSIAAGITGALQVAAILAKPIPQYKDGGTTSQELIIAGEEGIEKYKTPSGEVGYTPGRATLMKLPVGTEIKDHDETMRELAANGLDVGGRRGTQDDVSYALLNKLDSVERTIKNKPSFEMNWTRRGIERAIRNGESRTYFLNEFYK
jgi:hypothetical protein